MHVVLGDLMPKNPNAFMQSRRSMTDTVSFPNYKVFMGSSVSRNMKRTQGRGGGPSLLVRPNFSGASTDRTAVFSIPADPRLTGTARSRPAHAHGLPSSLQSNRVCSRNRFGIVSTACRWPTGTKFQSAAGVCFSRERSGSPAWGMIALFQTTSLGCPRASGTS